MFVVCLTGKHCTVSDIRALGTPQELTSVSYLLSLTHQIGTNTTTADMEILHTHAKFGEIITAHLSTLINACDV